VVAAGLGRLVSDQIKEHECLLERGEDVLVP
jgi:hypothetical protein